MPAVLRNNCILRGNHGRFCLDLAGGRRFSGWRGRRSSYPEPAAGGCGFFSSYNNGGPSSELWGGPLSDWKRDGKKAAGGSGLGDRTGRPGERPHAFQSFEETSGRCGEVCRRESRNPADPVRRSGQRRGNHGGPRPCTSICRRTGLLQREC